MIVELGVPTWFVSTMIALPLLVAPARALIGFKSDTHKSYLGWRRVPFLWLGSMVQFGGLAIMPFALLLLTGEGHYDAVWVGQLAAGLAFVMVGIGLHTVQTAGLALATDLAPAENRPRVVALLYVMLLVGMAGSAVVFSYLLDDFGYTKLVQVIQGAAVATVLFNLVALWKQEARDPARTAHHLPEPSFAEAWSRFAEGGRVARILTAVALGTAAFSMQDILLEPYGGEILGLSVAGTTMLTGILALGTLIGFAIAARSLAHGTDAYRLAGYGAMIGVIAFSCVIFAAPLESPLLFRTGTLLIGLGGGLFAVSTLVAAMDLVKSGASGIALGIWGAVQATAAGLAIAGGGALRDLVGSAAMSGGLGTTLMSPITGYSFVYHLEIGLLFATLVAVGPLVRPNRPFNGETSNQANQFGLDEFPA